MTTNIPHQEIRLILTDTLDTLNNLAQKYEQVYHDQQLKALERKETLSYAISTKKYDMLIEASEITSYKLNYIYSTIDLINDSPWFNAKHKSHSGTKT
jgi:hypothetical protein